MLNARLNILVQIVLDKGSTQAHSIDAYIAVVVAVSCSPHWSACFLFLFFSGPNDAWANPTHVITHWSTSSSYNDLWFMKWRPCWWIMTEHTGSVYGRSIGQGATVPVGWRRIQINAMCSRSRKYRLLQTEFVLLLPRVLASFISVKGKSHFHEPKKPKTLSRRVSSSPEKKKN